MDTQTHKALTEIRDELTKMRQAMTFFVKELNGVYEDLADTNYNINQLNDTALKLHKYYKDLMKFEQEIFWTNTRKKP